jgi:hypothetical protein
MKRILPSLLWFAIAGGAHAAPVTLTITGTDAYGPLAITSAAGGGSVVGTIPANAPYTATVTYDDAQVVTPYAFQGGMRSTYQFTDITVTMNGSTINQSGPGNIDIIDNNTLAVSYGIGDSIAINSGPYAIPAPIGTLYGAPFNNINIMFSDGTGTAFSGTALPRTVNAASYAFKALELTYNSSLGITTMTLPLLTASSSATTTPTITTASLPSGVYGVAYSSTVTASAPNADATTISIDPTTLPAGLSFNGTTISGIPNLVGSSSVAITATDNVTNLSATTHLPLTINDAIISFAPSISNAVAASAYSVTLTAATGGTGSFTYASSGLPVSLSLTGTTISGTAPATAGAYPFNVTATDTAGKSVVASLVLNVSAATPVACSGSNAVESAYSTSGLLTVNGGTNLLNNLWTTNLTAQNTTFLGGLTSWNNTGLILTYTGVTDPTGCILNSLTVSPAVNISTTSLATATVNSVYSAPVAAAWGVTPYKSFTVSGQPSGLSFDGVNLTGIPTVVGTFPITVTVIDATGATATSTLSLVVNDQAISFAPVLPAGTVGTAYSTNLTATGYGPFKYAANVLPAGLTLTGNVISGTPQAAGTTAITLTATDAAGVTTSALTSLLVNPAAVVTPVPLATSCTAPSGSKSARTIQANVTAVSGTSVTIGNTVVSVPTCAAISWQGNWHGLSKAIRLGYNVEVTKAYVINGVTTATALIVDNGL